MGCDEGGFVSLFERCPMRPERECVCENENENGSDCRLYARYA